MFPVFVASRAGGGPALTSAAGRVKVATSSSKLASLSTLIGMSTSTSTHSSQSLPNQLEISQPIEPMKLTIAAPTASAASTVIRTTSLMISMNVPVPSTRTFSVTVLPSRPLTVPVAETPSRFTPRKLAWKLPPTREARTSRSTALKRGVEPGRAADPRARGAERDPAAEVEVEAAVRLDRAPAVDRERAELRGQLVRLGDRDRPGAAADHDDEPAAETDHAAEDVEAAAELEPEVAARRACRPSAGRSRSGRRARAG